MTKGGGQSLPLFFYKEPMFDFAIMSSQVSAMRDMNPLDFTYKKVKYKGFRDVLNADLQMSLYGAHDAVAISVGVMRSDLKAEIEEGEAVRVYAPSFGYKGRELIIMGFVEDAGGLTVRMDLKASYSDE